MATMWDQWLGLVFSHFSWLRLTHSVNLGESLALPRVKPYLTKGRG